MSFDCIPIPHDLIYADDDLDFCTSRAVDGAATKGLIFSSVDWTGFGFAIGFKSTHKLLSTQDGSHEMKILYALIVLLTLGVAGAHAQTLNGAIDMHAHSDPDGVARSIDAIDLAKLAKSRGMRAIVLKNHYEPTASLAFIVRKEVPGIEVFGGISLDLTVGGVNPAAVEWMTKVKGGYGRVVWLPTFDSENQARPAGRPFSPVVRDGAVTPEVSQVIAIAAKNNLGHLRRYC